MRSLENIPKYLPSTTTILFQGENIKTLKTKLNQSKRKTLH